MIDSSTILVSSTSIICSSSRDSGTISVVSVVSTGFSSGLVDDSISISLNVSSGFLILRLIIFFPSTIIDSSTILDSSTSIICSSSRDSETISAVSGNAIGFSSVLIEVATSTVLKTSLIFFFSSTIIDSSTNLDSSTSIICSLSRDSETIFAVSGFLIFSFIIFFPSTIIDSSTILVSSTLIICSSSRYSGTISAIFVVSIGFSPGLGKDSLSNGVVDGSNRTNFWIFCSSTTTDLDSFIGIVILSSNSFLLSGWKCPIFVPVSSSTLTLSIFFEGLAFRTLTTFLMIRSSSNLTSFNSIPVITLISEIEIASPMNDVIRARYSPSSSFNIFLMVKLDYNFAFGADLITTSIQIGSSTVTVCGVKVFINMGPESVGCAGTDSVDDSCPFPIE
ncbi:hypothetical protein BLOT_003454 [Blomia tropicalis]|nr:hypothetical protein BLOT_003454 [Blomia tropicalis]